jgi:hypothetical protein
MTYRAEFIVVGGGPIKTCKPLSGTTDLSYNNSLFLCIIAIKDKNF